ncbi:Inner membrane ABC transporter permease protein YejE [Zhongshania aliphaticivorans]|uniref:Inner membrane ABC transporter permease protein YejE n=1 Tax=Zhongshania aliphaticivorans TaxID=1470434 RepID=A0A5S9NFH2_9GAMM|nr:ABC transporter permease subunit [Zhongshania aliphaticivorans]CAA0089156.1 Inner membrane ABC transporter permease protein YejE [Zhongshania aliphaticivorans]CAA0095824.1 Inner membrane ABC transporter permease protein YejE [Zhongshania aliphaticivorans]
MNLFKNPVAQKRWQRFRQSRRGYYSAWILLVLTLCSFGAELIANNRALLVIYEGKWHFPIYGDVLTGEDFGLDYGYEVNYRDLQSSITGDNGNWVLMPPIPFSPLETDLIAGDFPPHAPSLTTRHYLGTDTSGRDVAARLLYGFRTAITFSILLLVFNYAVGVAIGCMMGFWGGAFDLIFQRIIEIWSNIPFLYVIMIVASVITPGFWTLLLIMAFFGWTSMTWYMRTATYKEVARDYVMAARALGASSSRIVFRHILPNSVSTLVTFVPFSVASGITSLTALDYLGFGLPAPTSSWGELLKQGTENLESLWLVGSVVTAMTLILMLVAYIGEAIRDAYDPRKFSFYE